MLLLFKGPHRFAAQVVIGVALLAIGVVAHATFGILLGGVLLVWGRLHRDRRPQVRSPRVTSWTPSSSRT